MKRMRFFSVLVILLSLNSCGGSGDDEAQSDPNKLVKLEGGKYGGGVLNLNSIEDYTSLFPASINDIYSTHIATLGYEGLLRLNQKTLEIESCVAESYTIDKSKKIYTFKIRKGITFFDDECFDGGIGREVTATDFKYCFEFLCSNSEYNKWSSIFRDRLVGANEFLTGKSKEVKGIKVVDEETLEMTLIEPYAGFPHLLTMAATSVYPKEAIDKYGHAGMQNRIIGCGPFIPSTIENGKNVLFVKNEKYWRKDEFGNKLPFLNQVAISFIKDKNEELQAFKDEKLDMVWGIPVEEVQNIMGTLEEAKDGKNTEFEVQSINSLNIQYYGFLNSSEVFKDVRVRKAFNYAIDRDSLVDFILLGEGIPAHNGFVPEMKGYPSRSVKGFDFDLTLAKKLMAEAGYPGGKGFPEVTLNLNASGGINEKVAAALTGMLNENLGINIALKLMPMSELHPKVEKGQVDFWRFGWIADYPDPSNFLYLFHSKNIGAPNEASVNYFRYSNPLFDKMYEASLKEIDYDKRMALYALADQILMDDAVIMPLYFNLDIRLIDPNLKDFDINEMQYQDLAVVYYKMESKANKENVRVYENLAPEEGQ
jgi:peptide/nickel transport system substrate-binding protein